MHMFNLLIFFLIFKENLLCARYYSRYQGDSETKHKNVPSLWRNHHAACNLIFITTTHGKYSNYLSFTDEETETRMDEITHHCHT